MSITSKLMLKTIETGVVPECLTRLWVRHLCKKAVCRASLGNAEARHAVFRQLFKELKLGASLRLKGQEQLNNQELEHDFFSLFLGKRLNFGCCYFSTGAEDLDEAEDTMLWISADRAKIRDGMKILEIGCSWGAMSLWLAEQLPNASITALTDSPKKLIYIQKQLKERGLTNVRVYSTDFENFSAAEGFDRVICLERFDILSRLSNWEERVFNLLNSSGKLFIQQCVHSGPGYYSDAVGLNDMPGLNMAGIRLVLPSEMLLMFQNHMAIEDYWRVSGEHYAKTAEKMLKRFYLNRLAAAPLLERVYGKKLAYAWFLRWSLFLTALSEIFAYNMGQEWVIAQYLYKKR